MDRGRRRRVPAFGEWNYYHYYGDNGELPTTPAACYGYGYGYGYGYAPPEPEACSDVWFSYSPPPRKPVPTRKPRRPADRPCDGGKRKARPTRTPARTSSSDGGAATTTPAKAVAATRTARVVRPVDADLYQVPPPDFFVPDVPKRMKKKKATRSIWLGCFGLSCVA